MVKTLQDFCLACIAKHISSYSRLGSCLSLRHKEVLLERICWHELLTVMNTPSIVYHLVSHNLQRVHLSYSDQVDDKMLGLLGDSSCLLHSIIIDNCRQVTDKGVSSLGRIMRKAKVFKLKYMRKLTGEGLKTIKSRTLECVSFNGCTNMEDGGVVTLARHCPNIRRLNLHRLHKVSDNGIVQIAEMLGSKLLDLNLCDLNLITSRSTASLAQHCCKLSIANLGNCVKLDGSGLIQMAEKCNLSSLCISFCYKVTPRACEVVVSLLRAKGSLAKLDIMGVGVTPLVMEMLASTSSLTTLDLCGVSALNDEMVEMIAKTAGNTLTSFDISNCPFLTDQSCASISRYCVALEVLGMRNLKVITGEGLSQFFLDKKRADKFQKILLSGTKNVSRVVVEQIVMHCPQLETLTLAGVKGITDAIPEAISRHCTNIKYLSFRNCDLTDVGVCSVAVSCSQLVTIALAGIHCLTDKTVVTLAENCPNLRELYISGCAKITKQAVTYLKDCAVGYVLVSHSTPNQPQGMLMAKDLDTGEYLRVDHLDFDVMLPPHHTP